MISVSLTLVFVMLVGLIGSNTTAYAVYIDEQEKLVVRSTDRVEQIRQEIQAELDEQYDGRMEVCNQIEYTKTWVWPGAVTPEEKIKEILLAELDVRIMAAAISVDSKIIAYMETEEQAEQLLQDLRNQYTRVDQNEKLLEIGYEEKVEVQQGYVNPEQLLSMEEARNLITTGTSTPQKYVVEEGDCLWLIARRNDMYVDDIINANGLKTENLSLGQELILEKSQPYISVLSKVEGEKTEAIPYETKVLVDKSSSTIKVTQAGMDGQKHIAYVATMINGVLQEREILEEDIIKEPIDKVIVKGSQVVQVASRSGGGTGALDWPVYGSISQYYRSGHLAIDIATKRGTPIKAADSGYVTYAGYQGGYGNFIIVDHGNGIVTRYAHCDSLLASVGQKVDKGQTIATLGSTGRSTGPHLHFEVQSYGSFQNPLNYLK
jgi:murein DD-endopeptidase MepM/ murein hydrolase activator NlpD